MKIYGDAENPTGKTSARRTQMAEKPKVKSARSAWGRNSSLVEIFTTD